MQWDEMDTNQRNNLVGQLIEAKPLTQLYVAWDGNNLFCLPFTINTWTSREYLERTAIVGGECRYTITRRPWWLRLRIAPNNRVRLRKPDDNH